MPKGAWAMHIVMATEVLISAALLPYDMPAHVFAKALTDHRLVFTRAAIAAGATLLVTGDEDLLVFGESLHGSHQLVMCKPADALTLI